MTQPRPGYAFPGPVPQGALDYLRGKDLRPGFSYQDVWGEEHAAAFTVAKAMQLDILDDIQGALTQALAKGQTFQQFKKNLAPTLQRKGWWGTKEVVDPKTGDTVAAKLGSPRRLRTIFDANTRAAYAAGQWERIQRTKDALPYLLYQLGPSLHHRPEHVAWNGTLLRADDPWWGAHMPPNGWGCQCWVRQVGPSEYGRLAPKVDIRTEAPAERPVEWVNQRTGVIETADQGLDPAWARNPGQDRQALLRTSLTDKAAAADTALARQAAKDVMGSPILDEWLKDGQGELPAGVVDKDVQAGLQAKSQVVRLSKTTMEKQGAGHPELQADDYRQIPDGLGRAEVITGRDGKLLFFWHEGEALYMAVVKPTADATRLYLASYHRAKAYDLRFARQAGTVVRGESHGE